MGLVWRMGTIRGSRGREIAAGDRRHSATSADRQLRVACSGLGVLAGGAMLMIGAGFGAVAALTASPAGANTAHSSLPPVNVSVSNTPTVNVGNLPINSAGRVQVQNESASSQGVFYGPWTNVPQGQWYTLVNVSGAGELTGMQVANSVPGGSCGYVGDTLVIVIADGNLAFRSWVSWATYWSQNTGGGSVYGGSSPCQGDGPWFSLHYFPRSGIQFEHSLVVETNSSGNGNGPMQLWANIFYTVQEAR